MCRGGGREKGRVGCGFCVYRAKERLLTVIRCNVKEGACSRPVAGQAPQDVFTATRLSPWPLQEIAESFFLW